MKFIGNILKGTAIGVANVIPGVSGGTIALILGVYEKLTEAIGEFFINKEKRFDYFKFLFQIALGAIIGILAFAKVVKFLYENYPQTTNFFFLGLIASSVPLIIKTGTDMKISISSRKEIKSSIKKILFFALGFIIVLFFIILNTKMNPEKVLVDVKMNINFIYLVKIFICGAIASGAMIIPGISGSFLLILLGEYYNILSFINNLELLPLAVLACGMGIGILVFAKLIDYLLKKHTGITFYFILGLVVASMIEIWPGIPKDMYLINLLSFVIGVLGSYFLSMYKK